MDKDQTTQIWLENWQPLKMATVWCNILDIKSSVNKSGDIWLNILLKRDTYGGEYFICSFVCVFLGVKVIESKYNQSESLAKYKLIIRHHWLTPWRNWEKSILFNICRKMLYNSTKKIRDGTKRKKNKILSAHLHPWWIWENLIQIRKQNFLRLHFYIEYYNSLCIISHLYSCSGQESRRTCGKSFLLITCNCPRLKFKETPWLWCDGIFFFATEILWFNIVFWTLNLNFTYFPFVGDFEWNLDYICNFLFFYFLFNWCPWVCTTFVYYRGHRGCLQKGAPHLYHYEHNYSHDHYLIHTYCLIFLFMKFKTLSHKELVLPTPITNLFWVEERL